MDCQKEAFICKTGLIPLLLLTILFLTSFTFVALAQDYIDYEIQKGDCLWSIARQFQLSIQEIAQTNNIDTKETLHPGLLLKIPQSESGSLITAESAQMIIHTVKKGESLWEIAQQYHLSLEQLSKANELKQPNSLYIGQEVKIPISNSNNNDICISDNDSTGTDSQAILSFQEEKASLKEISTELNLEFKESVNEIEYVVKPGENLWTIAQNYQVSLKELSQANGLENEERLTIGQIIKIPLWEKSSDNKEKAGQKEEKEPEGSYIEHIVLYGETISTISQKYHTPVETICQLNQITTRDYIYPGQRLKVKVNGQIPPELAQLPGEEKKENSIQADKEIAETETVYYTVKPGDTLCGIAQKYAVSVEGIVAVNYLINKDKLSVGQRLQIPAIGGKNIKTSVVEYTVAKGDTLSSIAQKFNIRMYDIMSLNDLENVNRLSVGQKLNIPASATAADQGVSSTSVSQAAERKDVVYYVQKGDTLWRIAQQYQVSLQSITSTNGISENSRLSVGQKLVIPNARGSSGSSTSLSFAWPIKGLITSHFGNRTFGGRRDYHTGIDIDGRTGDSVRAAESGKVSFSGRISGYGNIIIIDHPGGYSTVYAHNSANLVQKGQSVSKGEVIARLGATGNATGSHLHFEVRENSKPVNPLNYLP
ncbi:MAG TPA: LysM peptidoglycan-binding domain-containing protein [Atribacterota bacterium]|nr:LysM peptidoglycan-binding domain-containing protein [Atribacterota bacterium]